MKKFIVIVGVLLSVAICASAQSLSSSTKADSDWNYSFSTLIMSKYYGTIVGGIFYDGPMSFTGITAVRTDTTGSNRVDLSIGQKLDRLSKFNRDGGNEYDLTVGRTQSFGSSDFPVVVDLSLCYLALTNMHKMKDDVISPVIRIDLPKVPVVQPYLVINRFDFLGNIDGSGTFIYGGLLRNQNIGDTAFVFDYRTGYSCGVFGADPGLTYHRLSVSTSFKVGKSWTVTPTIVGQTSGNGQRPGHAFVDKARIFASISFSRGL